VNLFFLVSFKGLITFRLLFGSSKIYIIFLLLLRILLRVVLLHGQEGFESEEMCFMKWESGKARLGRATDRIGYCEGKVCVGGVEREEMTNMAYLLLPMLLEELRVLLDLLERAGVSFLGLASREYCSYLRKMELQHCPKVLQCSFYRLWK